MDNITATETFLERLRSVTAPSHEHLESLPVSVSIMKPEVTKAEYALYLDLMHDVVKDTETNVFPIIADIVPDIDERRKTAQLESDLALLGHAKTGFSTPITGGKTITPAFAMGIMYVVEGSSLGGRVILKNIKTALGFDEAEGAQYFGGYGPVTGSHWKSFLDVLVNFENTNNNEDEIIAGANYAFDAIAAHFTQASR